MWRVGLKKAIKDKRTRRDRYIRNHRKKKEKEIEKYGRDQ